jgi:hypothetical protein
VSAHRNQRARTGQATATSNLVGAIHDGMLNGAGLALVTRLFGESGLPGALYTRLTPGESL